MKKVIQIVLIAGVMLFECASSAYAIGSIGGSNNQANQQHILGNGEIIHKPLVLTKYNIVSVSKGIIVNINSSQDQKNEIIAESNIANLVQITIKAEKLTISVKSNSSIYPTKPIIVNLNAENLSNLQAQNSATINVKSPVKTTNLTLNAKCSSSIFLDSIQVSDTLYASASSSAKINVQKKSKANKIEAESKSAGQIDMGLVTTHVGKANASSSSCIIINGLEMLDAKASSAAIIKYTGNAKTNLIQKSSGKITRY